MATSQHKKYFFPRKWSIYIALICVCSSTSLHTSTWLCLAAGTPLYSFIFSANTCPAGGALKATRFRQPAPAQGEHQQGFLKPAVWSLPLFEKDLKFSHSWHNRVPSQAQNIPILADSEISTVSVTRAGTRCGVVTLLSMLSRVQG